MSITDIKCIGILVNQNELKKLEEGDYKVSLSPIRQSALAYNLDNCLILNGGQG